MFKTLNFWLSSLLPQKLYWYLAGSIHPWQAVLEDTQNPKEVYERSKDITNLFKKLKLINHQSVVIDIGCGVGRAEYTLSKHVKTCIGVDISPSMIKIAKRYVKRKNVEFFENNGRDLKIFEDNRFDLVFSILVFQHLPISRFANYLNESYRILKNRGSLLFQIPFTNKPNSSLILKNHPWAIRSYNKLKLMTLLKNAGFKKIKFLNVTGSRFNNKDSQLLVLVRK